MENVEHVFITTLKSLPLVKSVEKKKNTEVLQKIFATPVTRKIIGIRTEKKKTNTTWNISGKKMELLWIYPI